MTEFRTFYRVARSFEFGSRSFRRGEVIPASDPIVEALSHRPDLLLVTVTRTERPEAVAGLRSAHERRPRRDWLTEDPWRIP